MQRITVINIKGGCGKTTISTNLASAYANRGHSTALIDYDPQGSGMHWLKKRDDEHSFIHGIAAYPNKRSVTRTWQLRLPLGIERVIVDTPAGLSGLNLIDQLKGTHTILIPVLPSSIDSHATADFIRDLYLIAKVRPKTTRICIVCNRVKANTLSFKKLDRFLKALDLPVIARLRDTQSYIKASEAGLGIHEMGSLASCQDLEDWQHIIDWLEGTDIETEDLKVVLDGTK